MRKSVLYETYWQFAAERHAIYMRRIHGSEGPWTSDPVLGSHRFTNTFRAADRVSQYLIRNVQYGGNRSQDIREIVFRTLLFKFFNRIDTWELLEEHLGPIEYEAFDWPKASSILLAAMRAGRRLYSAAYIMPPPRLGHARKHDNHLALLKRLMEDGTPQRIGGARSLREVYELLLPYPGLGPFLAYQYAIDINYSSALMFSEGEFVVAGPGALDGISKCFPGARTEDAERLISEMSERQHSEFARLGLEFDGLFGRPLQLIDCQNLFCEISKYARVSHPEIRGASGRSRIKQSYRADGTPLPDPFFPPKWKLSTAVAKATDARRERRHVQGALF